MLIDTAIYTHLSEVVICCDRTGRVAYANPAAQRWCEEDAQGQPFINLLAPEAAQKGLRFFEAARTATHATPTAPWELTLGDARNYTIGSFRGFAEGDDVMLIGQIQPPEVGTMQRELLALTSELSEAQREQRRQNRVLRQALEEQGRLLETVRDLTAPAVLIWRQVLLLPLVGQIDGQRVRHISEQLFARAHALQARYVIMDLSGLALTDTSIAQELIAIAQSLRLQGIQTILVGINPETAQTIVHLGIELPGFIVHSDLYQAMAFVLRQFKER